MRGKCRAQGKDEKKMKNRKHIVVFLLAVSLLLTLAACGGMMMLRSTTASSGTRWNTPNLFLMVWRTPRVISVMESTATT